MSRFIVVAEMKSEDGRVEKIYSTEDFSTENDAIEWMNGEGGNLFAESLSDDKGTYLDDMYVEKVAA